jgi:exonuclease SbcC
MYVEVEFEIEDSKYTVYREYSLDDEKTGLIIKQNGDIISQSVKGGSIALSKIIGASRELLMESVIISQGELSSFIQSIPSQRRDLIGNILGLELYNKACVVIKEVGRDMSASITSRNSMIDNVREQMSKISAYEEIDKNTALLNSELSAINSKVFDLTQKRESILAQDREKKETLNKSTVEMESIKSKMAKLNLDFDNEIRKIENEMAGIEKQLIEVVLVKENIEILEEKLKDAETVVERLKELRFQINGYDSEIKQRKEKLAIMSGETSVCPLCGSNIGIEKWQQIVSSFRAELSDFIQKLDTASREVGSVPLKNPETIRNEIDGLKGKVAKIEGMRDSRHVWDEQLTRLKTQKSEMISELEANLNRLMIDSELLKTQLNTEIDVIEKELEILKKSQSEYSSRLIEMSSARKTRESLENSIQDIEQNLKLYREKLPETEFVISALSPGGIPLMITDHYLPQIISRAQELAFMMSDGQLHLKMEIIETGNKKGIEIYAGTDALRPIQSLSGGEGTRVSLAIRVALSQILGEISNCKFDILIVDEPDFLDDQGIGQFIAAINTLKNQYRQLIVMSHVGRLKDAFTTSIVVTKGGNGSEATIV